MHLLAIDLGGTKLATAIFSEQGLIIEKEVTLLAGQKGSEVAALIAYQIKKYVHAGGGSIASIGISVPGISYKTSGKVWAPNIPGWNEFPLLNELKTATDLPVTIESDRACYILGEHWKGAARNCMDAVYLAIGTGIGAGILAGGRLLRGANDISGAVGWMALDQPFEAEYEQYGCFEYSASGDGIARFAKKLIAATPDYNGRLAKNTSKLTAAVIFEAIETNDPIAIQVRDHCIARWGMAVANLVSLLNPEKIILGGGVFGPAVKFIPDIFEEAKKWAQPVSMMQVELLPSELGSHAGLYGAAMTALNALKNGEGQ